MTGFVALWLAKVSAILILGWMANLALRHAPASWRHHVWTMAITAAMVLPLAIWAVPQQRITVVNETVTVPATTIATTMEIPPEPAVVYVGDPARTAVAPPPIPRASFRFTTWGIAMSVWIAGSALLLVRLMWGLWQLRGLRKSSRLVESLPGGITLLEASSASTMPLTGGWRAPYIVMPRGFAEWEPQRLGLVLAHESAHVARRDWAWQIAAELARMVYWFHPLMWLAIARMRQESERAADDVVVNAGFDGPAYARHLLDVAREYRHPFGPAVVTSAMARPSSLQGRIAAVLDTKVARRPLSRGGVAASLVVAVAVMIPLAAIVPAQERVIVGQPGVPPATAPAAPVAQGVKPLANSASLIYEIHGTVMEPGLNQPVVDAEVALSTETREIGKPIVRNPIETVRTNATGAFRFRLESAGTYVVNTNGKEGYIRGAGTVESFQRYVTLTEGNRSVDIEFFQTREAEITGTLIDDETGSPLSGVQVIALPAPSARGGTETFGNLTSAPGAGTRTDAGSRSDDCPPRGTTSKCNRSHPTKAASRTNSPRLTQRPSISITTDTTSSSAWT